MARTQLLITLLFGWCVTASAGSIDCLVLLAEMDRELVESPRALDVVESPDTEAAELEHLSVVLESFHKRMSACAATNPERVDTWAEILSSLNYFRALVRRPASAGYGLPASINLEQFEEMSASIRRGRALSWMNVPAGLCCSD